MPSFDLLKSWIDESYRAQAPKKLARGVTGPDGAARPKKAAHS